MADGEKKFKCGACETGFTTRRGLNVHCGLMGHDPVVAPAERAAGHVGGGLTDRPPVRAGRKAKLGNALRAAAAVAAAPDGDGAPPLAGPDGLKAVGHAMQTILHFVGLAGEVFDGPAADGSHVWIGIASGQGARLHADGHITAMRLVDDPAAADRPADTGA